LQYLVVISVGGSSAQVKRLSSPAVTWDQRNVQPHRAALGC